MAPTPIFALKASSAIPLSQSLILVFYLNPAVHAVHALFSILPHKAFRQPDSSTLAVATMSEDKHLASGLATGGNEKMQYETENGQIVTTSENQLHRNLRGRHMQMIFIHTALSISTYYHHPAPNMSFLLVRTVRSEFGPGSSTGTTVP